MCMSRLFINPSHSGRLSVSFAIIFYTGIIKRITLLTQEKNAEESILLRQATSVVILNV